MGIPPAGAKALGKVGPLDVNDFFPHGITIHKGDKIKFAPVGFHSVDIPTRGGDITPLISPTGAMISGSNDAAGNPFWFNGQPQLGFTPSLFPPGAYGKKLTYNGKKEIVSGLPLAPKNKPFTVKFTKTGKFTYFCNLHAGMKGTVTVKPKGKKIPSKKADKKALKRQIARSIKTAKTLSSAKPPANTIDVGVAGKHGEELFAFTPSTLTVKPDTTINFRMSPGTKDVHTATTGPGDPEKDPNSYLGQVSAGFNSNPFDPRAIYPSEAPGTPAANLTPGFHGNGFWSSGAMDGSAATPQLPSGQSVTFSAPGTYQFYCMIHPFMHATVTVQ